MHEAEQRAEYDLLMQSQYWSPDQLRALQHERLETILRHARAHVPFYAKRLDVLFRANGSIDWERWADVPILKRASLVDQRRALLSRSVPPGHGQIADVSTSGSTGAPVKTSHTSISLQMSNAALFRAMAWDQFDYSKHLGSWAGDNKNKAAWPEGRSESRWGPAWDETATGRFHEVNQHTSLPNFVEFLKRRGVSYLTAGATHVRLLAYEAPRLGLELSLERVLTRSSAVSESDRAMILEAFGARTSEFYASKEGHRMAHPCPTTGGWHVNDEELLLEILDDDGNPSAVGQVGRIVITPFQNFAQPLIRYDHGDLAVRGAPCACGRGLSVIERIAGRVRHMFVLPDGARIVPFLSGAATNALNAAIFQVAQVSRERLEVRYVPRSEGAHPDEDIVRHALDTLTGSSLEIAFRPVERFEVAPERKHMEFVSELEA